MGKKNQHLIGKKASIISDLGDTPVVIVEASASRVKVKAETYLPVNVFTKRKNGEWKEENVPENYARRLEFIDDTPEP